jgi:EAL domain-containing protein (putative c-di-GMP-specific phosphodiesterase class I)
MAHGLELTVVGEGVETEEQKAFLVKNRCDHLQGFIYSEPLSFDAFTQLLRSDGTTARRTYLSVVDK